MRYRAAQCFCVAQKSPDTPGSPEGNTEGPGTASSELKSKDITFPTKVRLVKAMVSPVADSPDVGSRAPAAGSYLGPGLSLGL